MSAPATIEGTWLMLRAEFDGEAAPAEFTRKVELTLLNGGYDVRFGGVVSDSGHYELSAAPEQRTLTLHGSFGPNAGRTIPCLYQLAGDRLRICYGIDGELPTRFATATGERRYLATYRRK